MKVNTFIIGAQKAGTTSLYEWLIQHPDIFGEPSLKEFPFFCEDELFNRGIDFFEQKFESRTTEKVAITGCVDYIEHKKSLERIKKYNNDAKVILVLRKPEDRIKSAFSFLHQVAQEKHTSINKAIEGREEYLKRSLYGPKLEMLHQLFQKRNIKVVLFERMVDNPENTVLEIIDFLGASESVKIDFHNANKTGAVRYSTLNKLIFDKTTDNVFRKMARGLFPPNLRVKVRRAIKNMNTKKKQDKLITEIDDRYLKVLEDDLKNVKKYIDVDGHW